MAENEIMRCNENLHSRCRKQLQQLCNLRNPLRAKIDLWHIPKQDAVFSQSPIFEQIIKRTELAFTIRDELGINCAFRKIEIKRLLA